METISVGEEIINPASDCLTEQKFLDRRHGSSSVGARPADPIRISKAFRLRLYRTTEFSTHSRLTRRRPHFYQGLLFDGGRLGRPRFDRRAAVSSLIELLFGDPHPGDNMRSGPRRVMAKGS